MTQKTVSILLITLSLFSLWALFAVIIVNHSLHEDLPGYTVGELCRWDLLAFIVAGVIAYFMIRLWGIIQIRTIEGKKNFTIPYPLGIYFLTYFLLLLIIGAWQWLLFSQGF